MKIWRKHTFIPFGNFSMIILNRDGRSGGEGERVARHELMHGRHTVSLLTDHLVFSPKYRGKVLLGEVAEAAEEIIRENCKELDIEVIDMAVNRTCYTSLHHLSCLRYFSGM